MVILQPNDFVLQRCFLTLVLVFLVMKTPENDRYGFMTTCIVDFSGYHFVHI